MVEELATLFSICETLNAREQLLNAIQTAALADRESLRNYARNQRGFEDSLKEVAAQSEDQVGEFLSNWIIGGYHPEKETWEIIIFRVIEISLERF